MENSVLFSSAFIIVGSLLLYFGADALVKGASRLAIRLGITPMIIGLTVVAFGTSAPELVVSLSAGMRGKADIALGNVIGSNICNIALILGLSALIRPLDVNYKTAGKDIFIMVAVSVITLLLAFDGELTTIDGAILIVGIISYVMFNIHKSKKDSADVSVDELTETKYMNKNILHILMVIAGLVILMMGANLFLEGAVRMAKMFNLSDAVIGLTIVALGTSLPELATSAVASYKKHSDISLGNVLGSNIFNLLMILGATSIFFPINSTGIKVVDVALMILLSVIIVPLSYRKNVINRYSGAFLLLIYTSYMYYLFMITK
ncbi:calcium/sodium antiporter [Candidatus Kapaibacterium sp.]